MVLEDEKALLWVFNLQMNRFLHREVSKQAETTTFFWTVPIHHFHIWFDDDAAAVTSAGSEKPGF